MTLFLRPKFKKREKKEGWFWYHILHHNMIVFNLYVLYFFKTFTKFMLRNTRKLKKTEKKGLRKLLPSMKLITKYQKNIVFVCIQQSARNFPSAYPLYDLLWWLLLIFQYSKNDSLKNWNFIMISILKIFSRIMR